MFRLLAQKEIPIGKKMQSLSLNRSEVTPPTTPTKIGSFNFTSPTKVRNINKFSFGKQIK